MHSFLEFFFHHLETIIMSLAIFGFALGGSYIIYLAFFAKSKSEPLDKTVEIEELLKKVLAQANNIGADKSFSSADSASAQDGTSTKAENSGVAKGSSAVASEEKIAEINELKDQLKSKQVEIENLKKDLEKKVSSGKPSQDLVEKIKDLEARLAEYEIIEDDIADLSKYKEENALLKEELEMLKSGGSVRKTKKEEVAEDIDEEPEESEEETTLDLSEDDSQDSEDAITDDLINEFEQAVSEQLGLAAKADAKNSDEEVEEEAIDDNSEPEIEAQESVEDEDLFEKAAAELNATQQEVTPTKKVSKSPVASEEESGADDIFGEFVPEDHSSELNSEVDTDRMLAEMTNLEAVEEVNEGESVVDQELDVDKMVTEAQNLDNKG